MFERTSVVFWGVSLTGKALTLHVSRCQFESDMLHFYYTELAQLGRALGLGPRGREFESRIPYYEDVRNEYERLITLHIEVLSLSQVKCV